MTHAASVLTHTATVPATPRPTEHRPAEHQPTELRRTRPTARVVGQAHVVPEPMHQQELWDQHFSAVFDDHPFAEKVWKSAGIVTRHGALNPAHEDISHWSTGERMRRYAEEALPLGIRAVEQALADAGLAADEVGLFAVVSCTGYGTPGLDIRISEALGMSPQVQRLVVGHMGCYAAIPGLGAVSDYVAARQKPAVMLCLELTSLHPQPPSPTLLAGEATEADLEQLVAHALFADAAAAVVLVPEDHHLPAAPGPNVRPLSLVGPATARGRGLEVVDVSACTDWSTQELMRWDVTDLGFKMALSHRVPGVLEQHVSGVVDSLLESHGLGRADVAGWAVHPGGRRILEVVDERLGLPNGALDASYSVLRDYGNCSSPTVLLVLERMVAGGGLEAGDHVVAMAFGPGLTLYAALLRVV
jgi:alkylresorcinol/alkylpyrone synthase